MKSKAILYLSHLLPREYDDDVKKYAKKNMQDAANSLQWSILSGLSYHFNKKIDVINVMTIGSYPEYYKKAFIRKGFFACDTETHGVNIGFCNVKLLRRESIIRNLYQEIKRWCKTNEDKKRIIILYSLNPLMLRVLMKIKDDNFDIDICAIVADLPDMINLSSQKNPMQKYIQKKIATKTFDMINIVDKFVFLSEHMSAYIGNKKPYCVVEGIFTDVFSELEKDVSAKTELKTILYTGTLHKKFGILHLLNSFSKIPYDNYRLIICGAGDSEREIKKATMDDTRIIFKGQCTRHEVLRMQQDATVLVNPRINTEKFTRYSFPSKNMEYLSSGTPVIAFKLDGIPDEYDAFITYVEDETEESFANAIVDLCESSEEIRVEKGKMAKEFVSKNKNKIVQTKKIVDLIEKEI